MGCGPSTAISPDGNGQNEEKKDLKSSNIHKHSNGIVHNKTTNVGNYRDGKSKPRSDVDKNANKLKTLPPQAPVPKSVAFEVTLDGDIGSGLLSMKKRPPRLQALEPLDFPKLTPEQLRLKQELADEKRERIKLKKISHSQKSSRRRNELMRAREFGMKQQMDQEKVAIDENLKQAELKRQQRLMEVKEKQKLREEKAQRIRERKQKEKEEVEAKPLVIGDNLKQAEMRKEQRLLEIKEKQRIREEKAKRIRERAKKIQNPDEEEVEVERDMEFNANSDDSWLSNPADDHIPDDVEEEEAGLQKRLTSLRPTVSASTTDSYDAAFMRQNTDEKMLRRVRPAQSITETDNVNDDDFFGS